MQMTFNSQAQDIDPIKRIYGLMAIDSIRSKNDASMSTLDYIAKEKEIIDIYSQIGYGSSMEYLVALGKISEWYNETNDFNKCLEYTQSAIEHLNRYFPNRIDLKSHLLYQMSECYYKSQNYLKAIEVDYQNLEIIHPYQAQLLDIKLNVLHNLASSQFRIQDMEQTLKTTEIFIDIYNEKIKGSKHPIAHSMLVTYYDIKNIESAVLCEYGEYSKAIVIYKELFPIIQSIFKGDEYNAVYAEYDMNMGMCFVNLGDIATGAQHINKVAKYYECNNIESREYAGVLQMLSRIKIEEWILNTTKNDFIESNKNDRYDFSDIIRECISLQNKSVEIFKRTVGSEDTDYLSALLMLSYYYHLNEDIQNFATSCLEVINICDNNKSLQGIRPHLAALDMIGDYYEELNNNLDGIKIAKKYLYLTRENKSAGRGMFTSYESEIKLLFNNGLIDEGKELFELAVDISRERLKSNSMLLQDESQRNAYWDSDASYLSSAFSIYEYYPDLGDTMYDVSLLYKGAKLYLASKGTTNPSALFSINWKDVKQYLKNKEIAIEFIRVTPRHKDKMSNPYYVAITLRNNDIKPKLFYLCSEEKLLDDKNSSEQLRDLIWGNLKQELYDINTIYFSPMGDLNHIPIEYLPDYNLGSNMSSTYNIYRLSSTREITFIKKTISLKDAVIYGGIQYDLDVVEMGNESGKYEPCYSRKHVSHYNLDDSSKSLRSGVKYLKYTKIEAEEINRLLNENHFMSSVLTGVNANEESFKNLSGRSKSIIHISTHGFYWSKEDAKYESKQNDKLRFLIESDVPNKNSNEMQALKRTGLLMAGANNILKGNSIPDDIDDGILTALEIADLDLRELDLVVLSACQTGLGDISGEGVFGLQRGFKKAGACSILMSLWDVDDEATQILMTEFYKNYLGGMSKRESLLAAQKTVRETPGFKDPEYWAAFILLDGLN